MKDWIKQSKLGLALCGSLLVFGFVAVACQGIELADFIKAKTPVEVQQDKGLPAKLPVKVSKRQYIAWAEDQKRISAEWRESIDSAENTVDLVSGVTMGFVESSGILATAGPFAPFLLASLGLFIKRPGDVTKDDAQKEKQDSYNKGIEVGKRIAESAGA